MERDTLSLNEISYDQYHDQYVDEPQSIEHYKTRIREGYRKEIGRRTVTRPKTSILQNSNNQINYIRQSHPYQDPRSQSLGEALYTEYYDNSFTYNRPNTYTDQSQAQPQSAAMDYHNPRHIHNRIKTKSYHHNPPKMGNIGQHRNQTEFGNEYNLYRETDTLKRHFLEKRNQQKRQSPKSGPKMTSMEQMCYQVEELDYSGVVYAKESLMDSYNDIGEPEFTEQPTSNLQIESQFKTKKKPNGKEKSQEVVVKIREGRVTGVGLKRGGFTDLKKRRRGWIDSLKLVSSKMLGRESGFEASKHGSERKPKSYSLQKNRRYSERKERFPQRYNNTNRARAGGIVSQNEYGYQTSHKQQRHSHSHYNNFRSVNNTEFKQSPRFKIKSRINSGEKHSVGNSHYRTPKTQKRRTEQGTKSLSRVMSSLNNYVKGMLRESLRKKKEIKKSRFKEKQRKQKLSQKESKSRENTLGKRKRIDVQKIFDDYNFGEEDKQHFRRLEQQSRIEEQKSGPRMAVRGGRAGMPKGERRVNNRITSGKRERYSVGQAETRRYSHKVENDRTSRDEELGVRRIDRGLFRSGNKSSRERVSQINSDGKDVRAQTR